LIDADLVADDDTASSEPGPADSAKQDDSKSKPSRSGTKRVPRAALGKSDATAKVAASPRPRKSSKKAADKDVPPSEKSEPRRVPGLLLRYRTDMKDVLRNRFNYKNVMEVPEVKKVVINVGLGENKVNPRAMENATRDLTMIAGQKPVTTRARRSIAGFKLREGDPIGVAVTLRGRRMYDFLDRLFNAALPRIRDFRGVSRVAFDGRGNYSLGIREQIIFPEIDYNQIDRMRSFQVTMVTSAATDEEGAALLELMGMPFVIEATSVR